MRSSPGTATLAPPPPDRRPAGLTATWPRTDSAILEKSVIRKRPNA